MYEKLTENLRKCGRLNTGDECVCFHDGCCEAEPTCMYELMRKAADAIEKLIEVIQNHDFLESLIKPRWIPVTERLPEPNIHVLVLCKFRAGKAPKPSQYWQTVGRNTINRSKPENRYWALYGGESVFWEPTHWMPLPEPPKEKT